MNNDGSPIGTGDVIARLKALADEDGVVTYAQINDALGSLDPSTNDIQILFSEIERSGLVWKDEHSGPPAIPPDYPGLRVVRNKPG